MYTFNPRVLGPGRLYRLVKPTSASLHAQPRQRSQPAVVLASSNDDVIDSSELSSQFRKYFTPRGSTSTNSSSSQAQSTGREGTPVLSGQMVMNGNLSEESWRDLDSKVNKYPGKRTFTAIGSGGDEFVAAMVAVVERTLGSVESQFISSRPSSKGAYVSVRIGPVWVDNADQVIEIYARMKEDARLKWYM